MKPARSRFSTTQWIRSRNCYGESTISNQRNGLWPGEYVRVSVELEVQANTIAVPTRAVLPGQQGSYVFVVGSDKLAKVGRCRSGARWAS